MKQVKILEEKVIKGDRRKKIGIVIEKGEMLIKADRAEGNEISCF